MPARQKAVRRIASGPGKKHPRGTPAPRCGTHKKRSAWFNARAAWPRRDVGAEHLARQRRRTRDAAVTSADQDLWECAGPTNIGGRCTSAVVHPTQADTLWVGAAGGGVWRSRDGGASWQALWNDQDSLNIGALALDPTAPETLYAATGEANLSADSYPGLGVYRSADGGDTWSLWAPAERFDLPRRIGAVAVDPFDARHVRLGGVAHDDADPSGLFVTRDGGGTWTRENFIAQGYFCHAVAFHPLKRGVIFAAINERGMKSGIWRTLDGGLSWHRLSAGLPPGDRIRRTSLALAPSAPDIVYALMSDVTERVLGVFVSRDMGQSWFTVSGRHFDYETQMSYNNTLAVHPQDPRVVLCGGADLHRTLNGGFTWQQVTRWGSRRGRANYAHADHHCVVMPAAAPGRVYDCNDGGVDRSDDTGSTWRNRSAGLAVTMYYDIDVAPSDARGFGGGTQDNGTNVTITGRADDHYEILGGDGGWMVYDPKSSGRVFASCYNLCIYRFSGLQPPRDVSPPAPRAERARVWMSYLTLDPNQPHTLFTGSVRVWRSRNDGGTWVPVSANLDDSVISAIEVAPADSRRVYVGTENGGVFRSLDGGTTWSGNVAGARLPGRMVTRLETRPDRAETVFASVGGTGVSHVFASTDGGVSWTDIDEGRLPDVPHHVVVVPASEPGSLYVANDVGVYVSDDGGATWVDLSRNLPNAMVVDLVYHEATRTLYAATYGRSIWRLSRRRA